MNSKELINGILDFASEKNYPDVHLKSDSKIKIRNRNGEIEDVEDNEIQDLVSFLNEENIKGIIHAVVGDKGYEDFEQRMEYDCSYMIKSGDRYRVNCYLDTNGYSVAMRLIPSEIPTLQDVGLGEQVINLCKKNKGLVLVTGPTGSGKSTNLAAMIDFINTNYKKHIITIEDPVEFAFKSKQSLVNQREVGNHTQSFANAIRASLREDPDVIMIGEMRDPETIKAAITLAETGHLVFSTLHTNDSVQTIDRIIDVFPGAQQNQIRMQLSQSIAGVISQRLLPRLDGKGRIPAREILLSTDAVRNLILTGKTHQLYSVLEVGKKEGMILMDKYLFALYQKNMISRETLVNYARDKDGIEMMLD